MVIEYDTPDKSAGLAALEKGIRQFILSQTDNDAYDNRLTPKIGRFILTLTSVTPTIPLAGKQLRDISVKQRMLFQAKHYHGLDDNEFLGNPIDIPKTYFIFSKQTVSIPSRQVTVPPAIYKTMTNLCHERPDPVIAYEKLAMTVPRFVKDMQGKMKYLSIDEDYRFENADTPGKGVWVRTQPINAFLSIIDRQDVHIHRSANPKFIIVYNRWFGLYCGGE